MLADRKCKAFLDCDTDLADKCPTADPVYNSSASRLLSFMPRVNFSWKKVTIRSQNFLNQHAYVSSEVFFLLSNTSSLQYIHSKSTMILQLKCTILLHQENTIFYFPDSLVFTTFQELAQGSSLDVLYFLHQHQVCSHSLGKGAKRPPTCSVRQCIKTPCFRNIYQQMIPQQASRWDLTRQHQ